MKNCSVLAEAGQEYHPTGLQLNITEVCGNLFSLEIFLIEGRATKNTWSGGLQLKLRAFVLVRKQ